LGKDYLLETFSEYLKLIEKSNILRKRIKDQLMPLPITCIERNMSGNLSLGTPTSSESDNFV